MKKTKFMAFLLSGIIVTTITAGAFLIRDIKRSAVPEYNGTINVNGPD